MVPGKDGANGAVRGSGKEKPAMHWESILPKALTGDALQNADARSDLRMDSDAFAGFYERSARPLWAYLARVSADPALADDLMQESFVRFLCAERAMQIEDGEVASRRYLFRIATNLLRDYWRKPRASSIEDIPEELFAAKLGGAGTDARHRAQSVVSHPRRRNRGRSRGGHERRENRARRPARFRGRCDLRKSPASLPRVSGCCCFARDTRWRGCCANMLCLPAPKRIGGAYEAAVMQV